jgi:hypothetical protein
MKSLEEAYTEKKINDFLYSNKLFKEYFEDYCSTKELMENPKKIIEITNGINSLIQLEEDNRKKLTEFSKFIKRNLYFLTSKKQNELNEAFISCAVFSKGIKNWNLSSDVFLEFSEQPTFSLLSEETVNIFWKMADQINALPESKKIKLQLECPKLKFVLSEQMIKETKKIFENELFGISFLHEQNYQGKQKLIYDIVIKLEKILNALNQNISDDVPDNAELPKIKKGLLKFASDFRKAAATGRSGFKNIDLMIAQAQMVFSMFESLSKNWDYIQTVLKPEIKKIENLGSEAANQSFNKIKSLLSTMIIRTISKSGKGKWGERIAAIARAIKGQINYPLSLTPAIVASDIVDLITRVNEAQNNQTPMQQQQHSQQQHTTSTPTSTQSSTLTESKKMLYEDLESVIKVMQKLGDVFKKAEPTPIVLSQNSTEKVVSQGQAQQGNVQQGQAQQGNVQQGQAQQGQAKPSTEQVGDITDEEVKEELGLARGLSALNKIKGAIDTDPELKAKFKKFFGF